MEQLTRRAFAGFLAAAPSLGSLSAMEKRPTAKFPTAARDRLAVATYPFRDDIVTGRKKPGKATKANLTLEEFAQTIVPTFKVNGIEPWGRHFKSVEPDYIEGLRDSFHGAGVHVVNIPVDVREHLCGSAQEREQTLAEYHKWVDAAVMLGSPSIRVHLPRAQKSDEIACAVSGLKALATYGESKNIVITLENDDPATEEPERIVRVIEGVNSPYLRSLPDFCNSMLIHNDEKYNLDALNKLFSMAYSISHVKDSEQDGKNVVKVNLDAIFAAAKKARYKGYFSMEFDREGDPYQGTREMIAASLRNLG